MIGILGAVLLFAAGGAQGDAAAIAGRASRVYRGLISIRADFVQVIDDRMVGPQRTQGQLIQSGSANLAMRFTDPAGDLILLDGSHAWLYTPSTTPGQVIRTAIPHDPVYGPNVLHRILDRPAERYELTVLRSESIDGRMADAIQFVPLSPDPLFSRATVWIDRSDALPRKLELDERSGLRRTLELTRIRVNQTVPKDAFTFQVPAGVRIVDR